MANLPVFFFKDGWRKKKSSYKASGRKKQDTEVDAMGTGSSKPSAKRRPLPKEDRAPKKQKVSSEPVLGLMAEGTKTVTPAKHGAVRASWYLIRAIKRNCPFYSAKIPSMPWRSSRRSLAPRIMRTWETIRQRPWGRRASLVLPK